MGLVNVVVNEVDKDSLSSLFDDRLLRVDIFDDPFPGFHLEEGGGRFNVRAVEFGALCAQEAETALFIVVAVVEVVTGQLEK